MARDTISSPRRSTRGPQPSGVTNSAGNYGLIVTASPDVVESWA